jgi:tRNA(Arg) A34 adenosine deaminase TadA
MKQNDKKFIRAAIAAAQRSRKNGNFPFGAILVDDKDNILIEKEYIPGLFFKEKI